eukprot:379975-Pleurochrysis_carterae.AAC.2
MGTSQNEWKGNQSLGRAALLYSDASGGASSPRTESWLRPKYRGKVDAKQNRRMEMEISSTE